MTQPIPWIYRDIFLDFGDKIGARTGAVDSVLGRLQNELSKFRDQLILLTSKGLSVGARGRKYSACEQ